MQTNINDLDYLHAQLPKHPQRTLGATVATSLSPHTNLHLLYISCMLFDNASAALALPSASQLPQQPPRNSLWVQPAHWLEIHATNCIPGHPDSTPQHLHYVL